MRQKCLYNWAYNHTSTRHLFWQYIQVVHRHCYKSLNEDCFNAAAYHLGIPFNVVLDCVRKSFSTEDLNSADNKNSILEAELNYWKKYGVGAYPSVVINNKTFRGQIEPLAVYNAICAGFANPPEICRQTLGIFTPEAVEDAINTMPAGIRGGTMFLMIVMVILLNMLIVYCYRRHSKRELQDNMNS